jgi:DtxR family Mn-dependent transcriptional regulator
LTRFFAQALGIDRETAEEDACKIEHVISPLSMDRLTKFMEFIGACPLGGANFPIRYEYYLEHGELPQECSSRGVRKKK